MAEKNGEEQQEKRPVSNEMETRRIRGLSQRLRQPLSVESNVPDDVVVARVLESMPKSAQSPAASAPETRLVTPPTVEGRDPSLETRQVGPAPDKKSPPPEGLLHEGLQLQNRYKILGVVGVGGMGAVYKAQDLRFPGVMRVCGVKEMINTASDPQVRQMIVRNFEREASILATLNHPAIPQVYDYFTEGSRSYLVLEFIDGKDLEAHLAGSEGFLTEEQVLDWAAQLCDVLSFLHNHKPRPIIFRDLKPSNIMLDDHQRIRLVDFGIAKLFQSGEKGTMIGTEGYSPPEQYRGVAEPRGDIYALGATLHHLLSKQDPRLEPPFSFHERPIHKRNPTVSREVVELVNKALEYEVNNRWGSAEEFKRAILALSPGKHGGAGARGETVAFKAGGDVLKPLWRFACEDEVRGSVTVRDGVLFVPSYDHNVYALDAEEGKFIWKYPTEGGVASTPWISEGMVVFGSTDHVVYAVDAKSGQLLWTNPTKGRVFSSAYGEFNHIFIGSDDQQLYAIHQLSGRQAWTYATDGEMRSRPLLTENEIFFSCQMGVVYALSLNRELRWRFRARRGILASPMAHEGLIFIGSLDWNFYALDTRSGWSAWRHRTNGPIASTAVAGEGIVYFGSSDTYIYALDMRDGRVVWRYETEDQVTGSGRIHEGKLYIGGVDGGLYCLDAKSGALIWRYQTDGAITGTPEIVDGVLYVGSSDHYVYAIPV